ncbi:MAG: hypothetical protein IJF13_03850, partial [Clostridia bacterium]|nr:hypothetical protein [Clostridia bacterium]
IFPAAAPRWSALFTRFARKYHNNTSCSCFALRLVPPHPHINLFMLFFTRNISPWDISGSRAALVCFIYSLRS